MTSILIISVFPKLCNKRNTFITKNIRKNDNKQYYYVLIFLMASGTKAWLWPMSPQNSFSS